jgi:CheY-like chemotaxis protein
MLESHGVQCDTAVDGFEAVRAVEESDYDLVLMDVDLQSRHGLNAAEQVRVYERTADSGSMHVHVPILGISDAPRASVHAVEALVEHSPDSGFEERHGRASPRAGSGSAASDTAPELDEYLTAPLQPSELLAKVRQWATWTRQVQILPVIGVHLLAEVSHGDIETMLHMVDEFVRTALLQIGSLRNALITNEGQMLLSGCEVIRSAARRFGAVWLVRAASYLMWLISLAQLQEQASVPTRFTPDMDRTVEALRQCEEEIVLIGKFAEALRAGMQVPAAPDGAPNAELHHISETPEHLWTDAADTADADLDDLDGPAQDH